MPDDEQLRILRNRRQEIDVQMNDLQSQMGQITRDLDEIEVEKRTKKKALERLRVELSAVDDRIKKKQQDFFEADQQYKDLKKNLDRVLVDLKDSNH